MTRMPLFTRKENAFASSGYARSSFRRPLSSCHLCRPSSCRPSRRPPCPFGEKSGLSRRPSRRCHPCRSSRRLLCRAQGVPMTSPASSRVFGVGAVEGRQHCPGRNLCSPCRCISHYRPPICGTSSKTWAQKMHCIPRYTQQWVILVASRSCGLCLDAHVIGFSTPSMATWIVSLEDVQSLPETSDFEEGVAASKHRRCSTELQQLAALAESAFSSTRPCLPTEGLVFAGEP